MVPNSTHLLQPLDVALKKTWRKLLDHWKSTQKRKTTTISKEDFPKLLKKLQNAIADKASSNLQAGFCKTGIFPFAPEKVLQQLPDGRLDNDISFEDASKGVSDSVLELLKKMRGGSETTRKRKRKVDVPAGKSITLADLNCSIQESNEPASKSPRGQILEELNDSDSDNSDQHNGSNEQNDSYSDQLDNEKQEVELQVPDPAPVEVEAGEFYIVRFETKPLASYVFYIGQVNCI
ncbi:uncharacterized protein LOC120354877 [Nilaparvata lugens]|uniref:uncharacterized protein LOC120354877 n=1 Tax=Nilaparvata lugens TaxID=108931 RepID=UPI00193E333D|nr:uncharacterized protein LOC120354877 [Nilaparvata lugens]